MNTEIKQKWIEALKSGEYEQGVGFLRTPDDKFCCLGVLCDLFTKEKKIERWPWLESDTCLPDEVKEWSGIHSDAGKYEFGKRGWRYLSDDNDISGNSFEEIARIIENHF